MHGQETIQALINQTTVDKEDDYLKLLEWDADLGFMRQIGSEHENGVVVVGFCNAQSTPPEKSMLPSIITPRTRYSQLTEEERSIDLQGKGVGPRLYNTPEAVTGLKEYSRIIGMYSVEIDRDHILDTRKPSDFTVLGKLGRIARHAGIVVQSKLMSVRSALEDIHGDFPEGTQAVLYNQPPNARRREHTTKLGVSPEFIVIRDATRLLRKRGEAQL
jgi:hypothetical protein